MRRLTLDLHAVQIHTGPVGPTRPERMVAAANVPFTPESRDAARQPAAHAPARHG